MILETEKWTKDKPVIVAVIAPQAASIARDIPDLLRNVKERRLSGHQFPLPDLPSWFYLYHVQQKSVAALKSFVGEVTDYNKRLAAIADTAKELQDSVQLSLEEKPCYSPQKLEKLNSALQDLLALSNADLRNDFLNAPVDIQTKAKIRKSFEKNEQEIVFFYFVFAPCWLLFQMSPNRLYRKARRGDVAALEKLLNLDPLLLHDPTIGRELQKLRFKNKVRIYERLLDAVRKPLKQKMNRTRAKALISAFISHLSVLSNQPLQEPQLRNLYDSISQDTKGIAIDIDLASTPQARYKAIQRERPKWEQIIHPDKKK